MIVFVKKKDCWVLLILLNKKKVTDEIRDSMNILKVISPNVKMSYSYHGITEVTEDQIKFYITEQLGLSTNSFESKELFMIDDTMKSIFSGTGIMTDDGVKKSQELEIILIYVQVNMECHT